MNREIPGFFYDKEKNRYFKIEPTANAAPSSAAYTTDNVRKRKAEAQVVTAAAKRLERFEGHIRRAAVLDHPHVGARLVREFGVVDSELPVKTWTRGLRDKGAVPISEDPDAPAIPCMLVNGDDKQSGMGVVYAATEDRNRLTGCYIPTDKDDRINYSADPLRRRSRRHELRDETMLLRDITSINYHAASHQVVLTARVPENDELARLVLFSPPHPSDVFHANHDYAHEPGPHPSWLLGENDTQVIYTYNEPNLELRTARLAPPTHGSSALTAIIATNQGIMRVTTDPGRQPLEWIHPPLSPSSIPPRPRKGAASLPPTQRYRRDPLPPDKSPEHRDVLSVDWHPTQPAIVYAGHRSGRIFRADARVRYWRANGWAKSWHQSPVASLRSLDEHRVLAAGPGGSMAVYDVRWLKGTSGKEKATRPVARMYGYRSGARVDLGLDVATIGGGVGQVVAAGMDNGTVGVWSLGSGRRLKAGAVDGLRLGDGGVVKCLQWEKMPYENDPSLWVAAGSVVRKFTYGLDEGEDGDC